MYLKETKIAMPTEEQTYRESIMERFDDICDKTDKILLQVTITNGKVRRIIMALIALSAFTVGVGLNQIAPFLFLFLGL